MFWLTCFAKCLPNSVGSSLLQYSERLCLCCKIPRSFSLFSFECYFEIKQTNKQNHKTRKKTPNPQNEIIMWDHADSHMFRIYSKITVAHAKTACNGVSNLVKQQVGDGGGTHFPGRPHSCLLKVKSSNCSIRVQLLPWLKVLWGSFIGKSQL